MSAKGFRVEIPVSFNRRPSKAAQQAPRDRESDDVPRLARLLALAHKWEGMVRRGETNHGQLARRHGLSSARVSQISRLTLLPPETQETILVLAAKSKPLSARTFRARTRQPVWSDQGGAWKPSVDPSL